MECQLPPEEIPTLTAPISGSPVTADAAAVAALDYADRLKTYAANLYETADGCAAWSREVADQQLEAWLTEQDQ